MVGSAAYWAAPEPGPRFGSVAGAGLGQPEGGAMRLEPERGERGRARASAAWAPPEVGPALLWPLPVKTTRGPPPFPARCGPPRIRIRPGLGVAGGGGGWSCPELPHVALRLEGGGLICSGWEVRRRLAPGAPEVARSGVSLPSSTRGLASPLGSQPLCQRLGSPFLLSRRPGSGDVFAAAVVGSLLSVL